MNVFLSTELRYIITGNFVCTKLVDKINEIFDGVLTRTKKTLVPGTTVDLHVSNICVNQNIDKMLFFRHVTDTTRDFNKEVQLIYIWTCNICN